MSCHSPSHDPSEPIIQSSLITVDQLPTEFDPTRTYHYHANGVDKPEDADIRTRLAWYPLDDRCLNPVGPRFTVELARDSARMADFGFAREDGSLYCATTLIAYDVTDNGS